MTLTLSTDREIGVPFDVRVTFESVARSALPPVLAFDLIETMIDESGGSTSRRIGARASFIAPLSTDLRESAYETQAVAPLSGHASGGPKGGVRYEWSIDLGHNANAAAYWLEIDIGPTTVDQPDATNLVFKQPAATQQGGTASVPPYWLRAGETRFDVALNAGRESDGTAAVMRADLPAFLVHGWAR